MLQMSMQDEAYRRDPYQCLLISKAGGYMTNLEGLQSVVMQLRIQRTNLVNSLRQVDVALAALDSVHGSSSHAQTRRAISASGRRKIAAAQRARWAKVKSQNVVPITKSAKPKRTMSASARRKIAASQRARWAKLKRAA